MRHVGRQFGQHHFGIGGDLDLADAGTAVGNRQAAHLGVVFGRDDDFEDGRQRAVAPRETRPVLGEDHPVLIGFDRSGLIGG